jgi:hypothetical protein
MNLSCYLIERESEARAPPLLRPKAQGPGCGGHSDFLPGLAALDAAFPVLATADEAAARHHHQMGSIAPVPTRRNEECTALI